MKKIEIENIRNINRLVFEIPNPGMHIITGTNGSGKTTLFTCISRICNSNAYKIGFPTSDNAVFDNFLGTITYSSDSDSVRYSKRQNGKWRPNVRGSTVFQEFGYPQIINVTTKNERIFTQDIIAPRTRPAMDTWLNEKLNAIFDSSKYLSMVKITTGDLRRGRGNAAIEGDVIQHMQFHYLMDNIIQRKTLVLVKLF